MNPLGCKWLSLQEYTKKKGIEESAIIAAGDDNNDAQMIKNAGCGIAMKNASETVKRLPILLLKKIIMNRFGSSATKLIELTVKVSIFL